MIKLQLFQLLHGSKDTGVRNLVLSKDMGTFTVGMSKVQSSHTNHKIGSTQLEVLSPRCDNCRI